MKLLDQTFAEIKKACVTEGTFVISGTRNPSSSMAIVQRYEQLNKDMKGDGGAMALAEDENKVLRWMVCSPDGWQGYYRNIGVASVLKEEKSTEF